MRKRLGSMLLALIMVWSLLPVQVLAAEEDGEEGTPPVTENTEPEKLPEGEGEEPAPPAAEDTEPEALPEELPPEETGSAPGAAG